MNKDAIKNVVRIISLRLLGLFLFLVMLFLLSILNDTVDYPLLDSIVQFLNNNVYLIIYMTFIFLFGELFTLQKFPLNLPGPLVNAAGSLLVVTFVLRVFDLVDSMIGENVFHIFDQLSFVIYTVVFTIVLIAGYITIFIREIR
ncbi:MAG: hypothetical protein R6U44_12385 [Archaeoglobaceae archaeon]